MARPRGRTAFLAAFAVQNDKLAVACR